MVRQDGQELSRTTFTLNLNDLNHQQLTMHQHIHGAKPALIIVLGLILLVLTLFWNAHEGFHMPSFLGHATFDVSSRAQATGFGIPQHCTLSLVKGWNLVSIACLNQSNTSLENRIGSIGDHVVSVHAYESDDLHDPWKAYKTGLPEYVQLDLTQHELERGYWIRVNASTVLHIEGTRTTPLFSSYFGNWSLVGYAYNTTKNISDVLPGMEGTYNEIRRYNASTQQWYVYTVNGTSNMTLFEPGYAYWINASAYGFLTFT